MTAATLAHNPYNPPHVNARRLAIDGSFNLAKSVESSFENGSRVEEVSSEMADAVSLGSIFPALETVGGLFMLGSAIHDTIPEAHREYTLASEEKTRAIANQRLNPTTEGEIGIKLAEERHDLAKFGLANQYLYGTVGTGLISAGICGFLSPHGAESIGFHPLVTQPAALIAGGVLGGVYVIRGSVVIGRSIYHLKVLDQFEKDFQKSLVSSGRTRQGLEQAVNKTVQMIERIGIGSSALARRAGSHLPALDGSLKGKVKFLQAVDKGVHAKKLQQKLNIGYGAMMILGGLASIAAAIFTFGAAPFALLIVAAVFFALMELFHASFEIKPLFEKLQSALYTPSQAIQNLGRLLSH
jgi:hypothetical protein